MDGWTDGRTDRRTDRWTDRQTDRRTDGRTDGWMDGWMDRWKDRLIFGSSMVYYPQGIILVYDITREETFRNVVKWMRNIEDVS